jgi:hypothetical protein
MGVGYCVSPLHRIIYLDTSALHPQPWVKGQSPALDSMGGPPPGTEVSDGPIRYRSPAQKDVVAWRERLARKYRHELAERLRWDEGSSFEVSDDIGTHPDVMFRYVAAVLDQHGLSEVRGLVEVDDPPSHALDAVFAEAERRGFGGRFPHLLLGASVWLPYRSALMIEEPNWDGHPARYGSVIHLLDEVTSVRSAISDAHPSVLHYSDSEASTPVLAAAWQASHTIARLAKMAVTRHLPLWATG